MTRRAPHLPGPRFSRRVLPVAAGGVLVLAGAGAALAQGPGGGRHGTPGPGSLPASPGWGRAPAPPGVRPLAPGGLLAEAASYLGVTRATLRTDLRAGKTLAQVADATSGKSASGLVAALVRAQKAKLDAAVKAGRITQALADRLEQRLGPRIQRLVQAAVAPGRGFRPGPGPRLPLPGFRLGPGAAGDLQAASAYLGMPAATLRAELRAGKTLAQVADATSGKSAAGLIAALVAAEQARLDAAVKAGRLTQARADAVARTLQQRVTAQVNGTLPPHGFPRPGPGHRPDDGGTTT